MTYDNTNSGVLFKNDKNGNEKRPDYKGSININGQDFFLSSWIRVDKSGNKFMSLKAEPKNKTNKPPQRQAPTGSTGSGFDDMDDDIPFISNAFQHDMTNGLAKRMRKYDF